MLFPHNNYCFFLSLRHVMIWVFATLKESKRREDVGVQQTLKHGAGTVRCVWVYAVEGALCSMPHSVTQEKNIYHTDHKQPSRLSVISDGFNCNSSCRVGVGAARTRIPTAHNNKFQHQGDAGMTQTQTDGCWKRVKAIVVPAVTGLNQPPGPKRRHGSGYWHTDPQNSALMENLLQMSPEAGGRRLMVKTMADKDWEWRQ